MMIDLFSSIEANLEDEALPAKRKVHYSLPRRIGTTTFLVDLAKRLTDEGKRVIFVVPRQNDLTNYRRLFKGSEVLLMASNNTWPLRGWHYDMLIGDNLTRNIPDIEEQAKTNVGGIRLYIDSVE